MNVQVYAGGVLAYDNRLPVEKGYTMQSIYLREKLNTGGSATLILPPRHPLRDGFPAFRTLVEIYRDGALRWRGRALPETRDFYCRGAIVCEGELCFLQDAVLRPGTYSGDLATVFTRYIDAYNRTVEPWKRFTVGNVTVTAPEALEILNKSAVKIFKAVMDLVSTYGGYIIFDSAPDGSRRINWYKDMPYACNQRIRLGYNLTDYSSSVDVSGFATRIIPYGAEDGDGNPITIDVDGKDYVESAEGIAQRGIIEASVSYPDITDPAELLSAAQRDVEKAATLPELIKLSALDMSRLDLSIETFRPGQRVNAESEPHKLTGNYDLVSLEEDLVNPGTGGITLTREASYLDASGSTLTGAVSSQGKQDPAKQFATFLEGVAELTSAILGADGGCVRLLDTNGDGLPDELYIADDPDIAKAVNVWRFNYRGLAASKTGYMGPFELGMALGTGVQPSFINVEDLRALNATIGGWTIGEDSIYSDLTTENGIYRVYIQKYLERHGSNSWIYSVQKYNEETRQFAAIMYIRGDGKIYTPGFLSSVTCDNGLTVENGLKANGGVLFGDSNRKIKTLRVGYCFLNSASVTSVVYDTPMTEEIYRPTVILTPYTADSGVIAAKVTHSDHAGFSAIIGGSNHPDEIQFYYIAFCTSY